MLKIEQYTKSHQFTLPSKTSIFLKVANKFHHNHLGWARKTNLTANLYLGGTKEFDYTI